MDLYDVTFFGKAEANFLINGKDSDYPFSVRINQSGKKFDNPAIIIFMKNESELIAFKNSVIWAYEQITILKGGEV